MARARLMIVNPILYHYRRGVFLELDAYSQLDAVFASDLGPSDGIEAMSPSELTRHVRLHNRALGRVKWQSGLLTALTRKRYDHVLFLGDAASASTWIGALVARLRGARVSFWTIGWHRPDRGLRKFIRLTFYRLAHQLLIYGNVAKRIGVEMGYPESRLHVIGNSVGASNDVMHPTEISLPVRENGVVWVGAVIRLSTVKRLDMLIEAAAAMRSTGEEIRVLLIGEGPEQETLVKLARRLGVPLTMPGAAYGAATHRRIYDLLDVTVVPSAIGLTAIQSITHGVPVVSDDDEFSQMPEWEAIQPGLTGELYPRGSVPGLVDAIRRVLHDARSPEKRSIDCQNLIEAQWSPYHHARRIIEALEGFD